MFWYQNSHMALIPRYLNCIYCLLKLMPVPYKVPCDKCFVLTHYFFPEKSTRNWVAIILVPKQSTQDPALDLTGGVMSNVITQDPLWLPTMYLNNLFWGCLDSAIGKDDRVLGEVVTLVRACMAWVWPHSKPLRYFSYFSTKMYLWHLYIWHHCILAILEI